MKRAAMLVAAAWLAACSPGDGSLPPRIESPWIRAAPPGASVMAGYLRLVAGNETVTLERADCEGFGRTELHRTEVVDGVATMRPMSSPVVRAGDTLAFEPGGNHLMLMEPTGIPREGDEVSCRLQLVGGESLAFRAEVRRGDEHAEGHDGHHH